MVRFKLLLTLFVTIGIFTFVVHNIILNKYEQHQLDAIKNETKSIQEIFARVQANDYEYLKTTAKKIAGKRNIRDIIDSDTQIEQKANLLQQEVAVANASLRAEVMLITDEYGKILVKDKQLDVYQSDGLNRFPIISDCLSGNATATITLKDEQLKKEVCAPILINEQLKGIVFFQQKFSGVHAYKNALLTNSSFVYYLPNKVVSSTLTVTEEQNFAEFIKDKPNLIREIVKNYRTSNPLNITLDKQHFIAILAPIKKSEGNPGGYAILKPITQRTEKLELLKSSIPLLGILVFLVGAIFVLIIAGNVLRPLEMVEQGVLEVICGKFDYIFKPYKKSIDGSLAHHLNIMTAILQGKEPPDSQIHGCQDWLEELIDEGELEITENDRQEEDKTSPSAESKPTLVNIEDESSKPTTTPETVVTPKPADGPMQEALKEEQYYSELFKKYIEAKEKVGDDVNQITMERFIDKLKNNEKNLMGKYDCKKVIFEVVISDDKVNLKPLILT